MTDGLTTIKVPKSLRERIATLAGQRRMTAAEVIADLLDETDRRARFDAVRQAYADVDVSYADETEAWNSLDGNGLQR